HVQASPGHADPGRGHWPRPDVGVEPCTPGGQSDPGPGGAGGCTDQDLKREGGARSAGSGSRRPGMRKTERGAGFQPAEGTAGWKPAPRVPQLLRTLLPRFRQPGIEKGQDRMAEGNGRTW